MTVSRMGIMSPAERVQCVHPPSGPKVIWAPRRSLRDETASRQTWRLRSMEAKQLQQDEQQDAVSDRGTTPPHTHQGPLASPTPRAWARCTGKGEQGPLRQPARVEMLPAERSLGLLTWCLVLLRTWKKKKTGKTLVVGQRTVPRALCFELPGAVSMGFCRFSEAVHPQSCLSVCLFILQAKNPTVVNARFSFF